MATLTELVTKALVRLIEEEAEEGWEIPYYGGNVEVTGLPYGMERLDPRHCTFHFGVSLPARGKDYRVTVSVHESRDGQGRR